MRHVPELRFESDLGEQHQRRIDDLLERIARRAGKGASMLLLGICLQGMAGWTAQALERLESTASIMGSNFRIACYAPDRRTAAGAITAALDEVRRVDTFLSHYRPESELSRVNRAAGVREVRVSPELADLLAACVRYAEASEGAFDVSVGALVDAWGFYRGDGRLPSPWSLQAARNNSGYRHLVVDRSRRTVRFLRKGMLLDPGGIGKGYAVDRAVQALEDFGIQHAMVSAGTSSLYALGAPPGTQKGWPIELRGARADGTAPTVWLRNEALSTSGDYEKFFESGGRRYGHILDPRTGRPATGVSAVSVVAPRTIDTEAWSTALYVNGEDWLRSHPLPDTRVYFCTADGDCTWLGGE